MAVSIQTQIGEAERELRKRREVYPRQVGARKMRQAEADLLIGYMEAIRDTLVFVRNHQAAIRALVRKDDGAA